MHIIWYVLVGLIAGWLAGLLTKGGGFGFLGNIAVGIVGSVIGGWLFGFLGFYTTTFLGSLVTAVIGAVVLVGLANFIAGSSRR